MEALPGSGETDKASWGRELLHSLHKNISNDYMQHQATLQNEPLSPQVYLNLTKSKLRAITNLRIVTDLGLLLTPGAAMKPRPGYHNLNAVLGEIARTLTEVLFADIDTRIEFRAGREEVWAVVDVPRLERILFSVIENFLQYGPKCKKITLSLRKKAKRLQISIKGSGGPIPEEDYALLFRKYSVVTSGTLNPAVPQGLSLALAEQAAREMDGSLTAENTAAGLTFLLTLPLTAGQVGAADAVYALSPQTVLTAFSALLAHRIEENLNRLTEEFPADERSRFCSADS